MPKIVLFDPNCYKFTDDMVEHWEKNHEVKKSLYYDPALVQWADIVWFETCDHNLEVATRTGEYGWKLSEMEKKKVICRVIDIEAWCGLHRSVDWSYVDETIFLAPHIRDLVLKDVDIKSHQVIPCGVNENKFTFSDRPAYDIVWVAERWYAKGIDYFLQFAATLKQRRPFATPHIYCVGIWADNATDGYYRAYIDQFIKDNKLDEFVLFIDRVDDMNAFLEEHRGATMCFSKKETFSYAIAEGMCKGLKPVIHNFYGAKDVWPEKYIWNTIDEAIDMVLDYPYHPKEYRDYVVDNYSLGKMLNEFDKLIGEKNETK